ncbi:MAG: siroheme synthase CysG, partial [Caulobacterales bacterium]|nr:siroheme synthase CysG [Caulobacterales bacterium]
MKSFPAFFPMDGRRLAVVGGGELARRKIRLAAKTPARIEVYARVIDPAVREEFAGRAVFIDREPSAEDVRGAALVIIAALDRAEAEGLAARLRPAGAPLNVVDQPDLCDWTTPAIVDRGDIVIGVASGGTAPVIARDLRARIEALAPQRIGRLAAFAGAARDRVKAAIGDEAGRRRFWERFLRGPAAAHVLAGDEPAAQAQLQRDLARADAPAAGMVHIVGAGPGDPELLTLKALRVLQDADVIFYDSLVGGDVLDLARRDARREFVGKRKSNHSVPQAAIHDRMIAAARAGERVVRLKGGDPFIFGRGGEELEALRDAGVEAEVVPGVSSALAGAAAAGAPLTHRDHAQAVTFVTGHAKDGEPDLDWPALARGNQTVVVFMGVGAAGSIAARLIAAGRAPSTPV